MTTKLKNQALAVILEAEHSSDEASIQITSPVANGDEYSSDGGSSERRSTEKELDERLTEIVNEEHKKDEQIKCDICLSLESEDKDQMVICDSCLGAVHQSCYKSELRFDIPETEWFCPRCLHLKNNTAVKPSDIKCGLCSDIKGVMTKIKMNPYGISWAHPVCVNWIPYFRYENIFNKDEISGEATDISPLVCDLCKISGYCISCDFADCQLKFHVKCAVNQGFIRDNFKMIKQGFRNRDCHKHVLVFCKDHEKAGLSLLSQADPSVRATGLKKRLIKDPFADLDRVQHLKFPQGQAEEITKPQHMLIVGAQQEMPPSLLPKKRGRKPKNQDQQLKSENGQPVSQQAGLALQRMEKLRGKNVNFMKRQLECQANSVNPEENSSQIKASSEMRSQPTLNDLLNPPLAQYQLNNQLAILQAQQIFGIQPQMANNPLMSLVGLTNPLLPSTQTQHLLQTKQQHTQIAQPSSSNQTTGVQTNQNSLRQQLSMVLSTLGYSFPPDTGKYVENYIFSIGLQKFVDDPQLYDTLSRSLNAGQGFSTTGVPLPAVPVQTEKKKCHRGRWPRKEGLDTINKMIDAQSQPGDGNQQAPSNSESQNMNQRKVLAQLGITSADEGFKQKAEDRQSADGLKEYRLHEDLIKMLRYANKDNFTDFDRTYSKDLIKRTFRQLAIQLQAYDEKTGTYNFGKSNILAKVFNSQELINEDRIWTAAIRKKIYPLRLSKMLESATEQQQADVAKAATEQQK